MLPKTSPRKHPLTYSAGDPQEASAIKYLKGTSVADRIESYRFYLLSAWEDVVNAHLAAMAGGDAFTRADYLEAFGCLKTNAVRPFTSSNDLRIAPLLNIASHSRRGNCEPRMSKPSGGLFGKKKDDGGGLDLLAVKDIGQGEVLSFDFDPGKPETNLVVDYGTFDQEHPVVGMSMTVELRESDTFLEDKCDILEINSLQPTMVLTCEEDETLSDDFMAFLRLLHLGGEDSFLLEAIFRNEVWDYLQSPMSMENESSVCLSMISNCKGELSKLQNTTRAQDEALMADASSSDACRGALLCRLVERRVLEYLLGYFQRENDDLPKKEYYHETRLKSLGLLDMDGNTTYTEEED